MKKRMNVSHPTSPNPEDIMTYEAFKAVLAENGITPSKSLLDITIDSMVNAGPEALKHITGFSSKEELLSNRK